ncbi:MAG: hypothetical protein HKN93_09615 [Acidimicrobiia bacterium]|nr:hypothetical protein [Acidimicrobiia bacterium]
MRVTLHAEVDTDVSSELIRKALLDFSDRRPDIWPQLHARKYEVHWVKDTSAEVTEGTRLPNVWSREHYDWSHPTTITWTAVESNFCTPGSHISMDISPNDEGGSRVAITWDRTAANLRGRVNLAIVRLGGNRLLGWATRKSLSDVAKAYER